MACALSNGAGFGPTQWTRNTFGDGDNWQGAASRYRSIRLADVNGDGRADVCGRNVTGVACAFSAGDGTFQTYHYLNNAEYRDDLGWWPDAHGLTLGLADIDGDRHADLCARAHAGVLCALSP